MKAIHMTAVGGPEVLKPVDIPEPVLVNPTQIKVRVRAAGVNPIDTKLRSRGLFHADALPAVLGLDGAGDVVEVGAEADRFRPGDKVWYCNGGLGVNPGNYAQFHVLEQEHAQTLPAGISMQQAAAAPLVLITAWEALYDRAQLKKGSSVLVHAGAGGVGHVAIQLAKLAGARVISTVSNEEKADFARALGADAVLDYRQGDWVGKVLEWTSGQGVNIVLDTVGGEVFTDSIPAMAHYGDLVTLLDPGPVDWKQARERNLRIGFELMLTPLLHNLSQPRAHQLDILRRCGDWMQKGQLRVEVASVFPLQQVEQAHRLIEQGHVQGKLVLDTD